MSDDQEYTTAVIVALPAADDPIHEHVAEDAHVTLHFLGEAADLDPEAIAQIKTDLELLSAHLHPFVADISGTAVLGKDAANVLLIESQPLSKIRDLLGATPAVSTGVASVEQFPNWIPHLTLAYPDDDGMGTPVTEAPLTSFTVGALALWLGGDKYDYPLAKGTPGEGLDDESATPVTAAAAKFDSSLHPRGADGRFIEKFGIVKFLTGGSWTYGQVTGIHKDAADQVKVTVTPSDLSGKKTGGADVELAPKQIYRAPKAKAHLTIADKGATKIGGQGGSNPGGLYSIPVAFPTEGHNGQPDKYYVKKPKSKSHGQNEALANAFYEEAGVPVPEVDLHADGQLYSKIVDGKQDMAAQLDNPEWTAQVQKNFAVDAWLGNRDVFGMTYDNVLTDANGTPWRIDNGGALLYRAMGEKKTDFGSKVTELDAFRQGKKAKIFGPSMSKADELDGAERVLAISPGRIEEMVADAGLPKSLADTLKARRAYIAAYYGLPLPESQKPAEAQEGTTAPLVDVADLAAHDGKPRHWFKVKLNQAALLLSTGDTIELPNGGQVKYGVDGTFGTPLSVVGTQAQVLGWQQTHGADAPVMFKKGKGSLSPRPEHGSKLKGSDLSGQNWQRGDAIIDVNGGVHQVLGANPETGAVLVRSELAEPWVMDTLGLHSAGTWEVSRWDPPAPVQLEEPEAPEAVLPNDVETVSDDVQPTPTPSSYPFPPVTVIPPKEKTGQGAAAETAIKADLDAPLPTGAGTPAPKKTAAQLGDKKMIIGDGTEAVPGDAVTSKKDGKTYVFVKPKGQYSVVTDPNGEDPEKQLLKLASTMTQPGKLPAGDLDVELPKTATGEVPALGMMALAKDGWAGEITLISPDGKFVFITDANGKRKRKSTGTVSITSGATSVVDTPQAIPGPLKDYGPAKPDVEAYESQAGSGYTSAVVSESALGVEDMVLVSYADGTSGLEPYTGQPLESLGSNTEGSVFVFGDVDDYSGPISAEQYVLAKATSLHSGQSTVVWGGSIFLTNGSTGPNGGLWLWDYSEPGSYKFELPLAGQTLLKVGTDAEATDLPEGTVSTQFSDGPFQSTPLLYGEEAKTLGELKGQLAEGSEISLDGKNWLEVKKVFPHSATVQVEDSNGTTVNLANMAGTTYVVKAPEMKDGDAVSTDAASLPQSIVPDAVDQPEPLPGEPVNTPLVAAFPTLIPGSTIDVTEGTQLTVLAYPMLQEDGSYLTAVMSNGDPATISILTSDNFGSGLSVPVNIGTWKSYGEMGVDGDQVSAVLTNHLLQPTTTPVDHSSVMSSIGLDYETAAYPIFFDAQANQYFRNGPTGMEKWDTGSTPSAWVSAPTDSVAGMEKVWEGAPFEGDLVIPATMPQDEFLVGSFGYKPKPGELVVAVPVDGDNTGIIVYPTGNKADEPYWVGVNGSELILVQSPEVLTSLKTSDAVTLVDPFSAPEAKPMPHQQGAQPPSELGAKLQAVGYTPTAGETLLVGTLPPSGTLVALSKQDDGTFSKIMNSGKLGTKSWSMDEVMAAQGADEADWFTWTYVPDEADAPKPVEGMPSGFAPYVPSEGQSLLKQTGKDGTETVYMQATPGASWFKLAPDGTVVNPNAPVANHGLQVFLKKGKSGSGATYELLHPTTKDDSSTAAADLPTFSNTTGSFTPQPGTKVLQLDSFPGDPDPWFYYQDTPGGPWLCVEETNPFGGTIPDSSVSAVLKSGGKTPAGSFYSLAFDGQAAIPATPVDTSQVFSKYAPNPGEIVFEEPNGSHWVKTADGNYHAVTDSGTLTKSSMTQDDWNADSASQAAKQVWPAPAETPAAPAPAAPAETPTFKGYTPKAGEKIVSIPNSNAFYVQQEDGGPWIRIAGDGSLGSAQLTDAQMMEMVNDPDHSSSIVWPVAGAAGSPAGIFHGYQSQPGEAVIQMVGPNGTKTMVKKGGFWVEINDQGEPDDVNLTAFSQDAIEWAAGPANDGTVTVTVLQGELKGPGAPLAAPEDKYAGVNQTVELHGQWTVEGGEELSDWDKSKIDGITLHEGESAYLIGTMTYIRKPNGTWHYVYDEKGGSSQELNSDSQAEQLAAGGEVNIKKISIKAPTAPPVVKKPYSGPMILGWEAQGIPNPVTFNAISDPSQGKGAKAGSWIYIQGQSGVGLFVQLLADWDGGQQFKAGKVYTVQNGSVNAKSVDFTEDGGSDWTWVDSNQHYITADPVASTSGTSTPAAPAAPAAPVDTPAAPAPAPKPSYPGALKPSQEDINAWGGSLTKDGHIPAPGMFVSGKGPMTGKIISVSKDKSKAVVLKGDGTKTTRLIEALKTDPAANYSAYAAPATLKDVPSGMPLAVDTVADVLAKTPQDGKFRAILSGHPGISGGQMVVTKATAPSGKIFNRVHFTITPAQREALVAMLAGTGEKGDWVTSSKMSDAVAIGDELPMRLSSTNNPDGTPRWKVDPATKPPTHTVTKIEDDPAGGGIKLVTMKDKASGVEIVSRFHPGKSLTVYTWDENKPKAMTAGAFVLSEDAKAKGWTKVNDGGISAISGGATDGKLHHEPGSAVSKGAFHDAGHSWETLRNVSADGVVIELVAPKGSNKNSTTGSTVISVPQGTDEKALAAALAKLGVDYTPMTQDDAKVAVRGTLRTLLSLDITDVDTAKGWSDEKLFAQAGQSMGISDLGWQDVLIGVDETTGKTSFFWSDRARAAIASKTSYNLVYRSASSADANAIVSTVKFGSANSVLKRTTGMIDATTGKGTGASWSSDQGNHAGHGSYSSASKAHSLPSGNDKAGYKSTGMMIYSRPEAVLGRIADFRVANSDAFGMGQGSGSDHLKHAMSMTGVKDFFVGGGLPTEAVGFIAVGSATERAKAIQQLQAEGYATVNGRPIEEIIITLAQAKSMKPSDLPPVTLPANARPILDLPTSYDAPTAEVAA